MPDLGRRLVAPDPAGAGPVARGQAGGQPGAAGFGRRHRPDERRAPAPVGDQGRPAGRGGPSGQGRQPADLRRAGRRAGGDRFRADRARSVDLRRCAAHPRPVWHRAAGHGARASRGGRRGDAQARRSAPRDLGDDRRRQAPGLARGRGGVRPRARLHAADPGRCDRGRGARGSQGDGRHRAAGAPPRPAGRAALRAAVGRRDHGDRARPRAGRAQRRVPAGVSRSSSTARPASARSRPTPTASTAARTMPARC